MVHADHEHLLAQIYTGKITTTSTKLGEYGGQKKKVQVLPGGIKIAAINQNELQYDPALYRRDRGELDWDQRSISTTVMMDNASTLNGGKIAGYDDYMMKGPGPHDIELSDVNSMNEPLLSPRATGFQNQGMESQVSLSNPQAMYQFNNSSAVSRDLYRPQERSYSPSPAYQSTDNLYSLSPDTAATPHQYPPQHQRQPSANLLAAGGPQSRAPSPYGHASSPSQQYPPQQHQRQMSANMLAGRTSPGPNQAYRGRAPSPGPNQAYGGRAGSPGPNQAYGARTGSPGPNQAYGPRSASPGPYQAYSGRTSPGPNRAYAPSPSVDYGHQQHARQASGNMLAGPPGAYGQQQQHSRQASRNMLATGPPSAYNTPQQHARQASGNMLAGSRPPSVSSMHLQQHARQMSGNMLASAQRPTIDIPPQGQQVHGRSPSGNLLAGGGYPQRGVSPVSPSGYGHSPSPQPSPATPQSAMSASQRLLEQQNQQMRRGPRS